MKKIKIKDIYLILVIVLGLIVISLYSTYALFTSEEITTNTAVNMSVGFSYGYATNEVEILTIKAKERKEISVSISNTSSSSINYNLYYELVSGDEASLEAGYTPNTENPTNGVLDASSSKIVMLGFINNSDSDIIVKVGFTTDSIVSPRKELNNEVILVTAANAPLLAEGMIPIMWNGTNWVKADVTNQDENYRWYNYDEKQWANAVMVNASSRDNYMNADEGTTITEDDVLAYYVWIPRYKYELFNVNSKVMNPILIDVQFESKTTEKSAGSSNGEYLTHPAFTFGTTELDGIWVGKFETSGTADNPTIKAGLDSLKNKNISTKFATSQKFTSGTTYLTANAVSKVDAHMMKNIEWGAVAYLKQSKYGLGLTDIAAGLDKTGGCDYSQTGTSSSIKNDQIIGSFMAVSLAPSFSILPCDVGNTLTSTSTTGNIYGVYDMAGGDLEYVMGVIQDNTNTNAPMSGESTSWNSGFTGKLYASGSYTSYTGTAFPSSKYYDLYAFGTTYNDSEAYARRILGDATSETRGWYSDWLDFAYAKGPWFIRGGYVDSGFGAGVFSAQGRDGGGSFAFRSVLTIGA